MAKFKPGISGNLNGRPKGSRNKAAMILQELLDNDAKVLGEKAIALAKGGDPKMLRLCIERIYPARRDNFIDFTLPKMESAADAAKAMAAIAAAVAHSEITPSEAADLSRIVENFVRAIEVAELERRIARLEGTN